MAHHVMIFAKDLEAMAAFYVGALGLERRDSADPGFVEMVRGEQVVVALHRIPAPTADQIAVTRPPRWREDSAMKVCIGVEDFDAGRAAVLEHGGLAKDPWAWEGRRYCECADVEGNPLQLFAV